MLVVSSASIVFVVGVLPNGLYSSTAVPCVLTVVVNLSINKASEWVFLVPSGGMRDDVREQTWKKQKIMRDHGLLCE